MKRTVNENYEDKYIPYYYLNMFIDNLQFRQVKMDCNIYNIHINNNTKIPKWMSR